MKDKSKASETFQEMLQRKLGEKRAYSEVEPYITGDDHVKPSRKMPRISKDVTDSLAEKDGNAGVNKAADMSEGIKNDLEEAASPQDIMEKDLQSSENSVADDLAHGINNSLSKRLRMYKCERCKSQYMGLAMLRQHCKDVHGDQKYYKCHVCGKLFSHPSSRNIHLRLHSGEKPYKCSTCGKQFRVSSHLKDHVRVHTGERPYICDICHKGFKQSSDLKKHRRTHTLDKPYKCPICPSAFTRSHHCRGHINSVHKFFKCGTCSALFMSEEAFEHHKELHPSVFSDQSDTSSDFVAPVSSSVKSVSAPQDTEVDDSDLREKSLKWDVANQLLELHKIPQHAASPRDTNSCVSETTSESGDDVNSFMHQSSLADRGVEKKLGAPVTVNPVSTYLPTSSTYTSPLGTKNKGDISCKTNMCEENSMRSQNMQPSPHSVQYLKVPLQKNTVGNKSLPMAENNEHNNVSPVRLSPSPATNFTSDTFERKELVLDQLNGGDAHSKMISSPYQQLHFVLRPVTTSQIQNRNLIEHSFREENSQPVNSAITKPQDNNSVPCHRVSVIQYHSSVPKPASDASKEHMHNNTDSLFMKFNALPFSAKSEPTKLDRHCQNQEPLSQIGSPMKTDFFPGFSQSRIPHVHLPLNADSLITLQSSHKKLNEPSGKYSMNLKEVEETYQKMRMQQEQTMEVALVHSTEIKQLSMFSQGNAQPLMGILDKSQVKSVDMLKFLAREQTKQKDTELDVKSPPSVGEESETSEASESGDVSNNGQVFGDEGRQLSSQDSLGQRSSPESSIHHCQVCKKTFSRSSLLKQHSVIHMGNKRFKFRCEVCSKMFRTRSHLRDHTRIHTGERPFKCHICQKAFKQSSDLKKHINLHTGANQFKCEECNMEFRRADALRKHKLGHKMGNMPCGHCGKNFMHISALRQHRAMHNVQPVKTNRAFHRCNYCFKTFTKADSYRIHMEEHTREQRIMLFDCKVCALKFFTEAEFTDHMNIHNGNRPHKCFICEKEFCIAEHLQDHVRLHTDVTARINCEDDVDRLQGTLDITMQSVIHA